MPLSADLVRVAFVKQTGTPPATPATPVFTVARITGEGVAFTPTVTASAEFDASGNIRDSILTGGESTGDLSLEISDHAAFEEYLQAVLGAAFTADVLKNGPTQSLYLLEKTFPDIPTPGAHSYHRFNMSSFATLTVSIAPGSPITGSVGTLGGEMTLDTAIIAGATYPDPGTEPVLVPQDVVVAVGGIAATACFSAIELTFDTNSRAIQCIGTLGTKETVRGRLNCQISATLYYATDAPVQALLDQSEFAITVTLNDASDALEYEFHFPRCKMTAAPVLASGTDTDVTVALEAQALYDETELLHGQGDARRAVSNPREKYGVDSSAERQGAPVVIDDMEFVLRSSLDVNRGYRYALALAYNRRRADFEKGGIEAFEAQEDITIEAFADRVILGWRNVTNGHGEPLEFNRENCIKLMQDCPQLWDQLKLAALDESRFKPAPAREDGEQLGKS